VAAYGEVFMATVNGRGVARPLSVDQAALRGCRAARGVSAAGGGVCAAW